MSKKAQTGDPLIWIVRIIGTLMVLAMIVFLTEGVIKSRLDTKDLRYYPIAQRALYRCFTYSEGDRHYPGIIDREKYTEDSVEKCFSDTGAALSAKFTLDYIGPRVLYYDEVMYNDLEPLSFSNAYERIRKQYYVIVADDGQEHPASLMVDVIWRE